MEKQKPLLREAETKDMKSVIVLVERLIDTEAEMSDILIVEDLVERKQVVMKIVAQALVDPDQNVWVVEKSGRILGVFIARKETRLTVEARNPVCVFSHAYSQKTVFPFHKIHNRIKEWANSVGCKSIQMTGLAQNVKIQKLFEGLGYNKVAITYTMEV